MYGNNQRRTAAFTIVSCNYMSFAMALQNSFQQQHPDVDFYIVLVDANPSNKNEDYVNSQRIVNFFDIGIPDIGSFIYRYSILELNTAVKPFAFNYFFGSEKYQSVIYLDPDILVFRPLSLVTENIDNVDAILTPHIRRPFFDRNMPSDLAILQSGTYNLGFVALNDRPTVRQFLDWWMEKLFLDCIVDIPNGLFVDQKWVDLLPGFLEHVFIIRDPGYNAAYWNLHERTVRFVDNEFMVDAVPLTFFHFSGYLPYAPHLLSKHQNRFDLRYMPELRRLCDHYASILFGCGYEQWSSHEYAFSTLPNKVTVPLKIVRDIVQHCLRNSISVPDPLREPEEFCRFLMKPRAISNQELCPVLYFLLMSRPDVGAHYPNARRQGMADPDFRHWVMTNGCREEGLSHELLAYAGEDLDESCLIEEIFKKLDAASRHDVFSYFENMWADEETFRKFADWVATYGVEEMGFTNAHRDALLSSYPTILGILNIYFLDKNLQRSFNIAASDNEVIRFCEWLRQNAASQRLTLDDVYLFQVFGVKNRKILGRMAFLYMHLGQQYRAAGHIFNAELRHASIGLPAPVSETYKWLSDEGSFEAIEQYNLWRSQAGRFGKADLDQFPMTGLSAKARHSFMSRINSDLMHSDRSTRLKMNTASFLTATSGMGESARSLAASLAILDIDIHSVALPNRTARGPIPTEPAFMGLPGVGADISITVANADSYEYVVTNLPNHYWAKHNVGYWVWETECLPEIWKNSQELYDEIWTPSRYSAAAIAKTAERPVYVIPHTLDFSGIEKARSDRARFNLPSHGLLFGFFFDPWSALERKNIHGLITAFQSAFHRDDNAYLVLKTMGMNGTDIEQARLRSRILEDKRIILIDRKMTRDDTFNLMRSLDAYVSLHRSEGFGLTCAEAMAMGIPVVATGYSGNLDFMSDENSILVSAKVIETSRSYGAYPAGTRWGDPDLQEAAGKMRQLASADLRYSIGNKAASSIRRMLDAGSLARQIAGRITEMNKS